jgi:hypothetical protein
VRIRPERHGPVHQNRRLRQESFLTHKLLA